MQYCVLVPCSLPLMWLESRGKTCIIKIRLIVVGNAVVISCLLKIDLDSKIWNWIWIRPLGLEPSLDVVPSAQESLGSGAASCLSWLLWPCS